jgi:hypothetical protein
MRRSTDHTSQGGRITRWFFGEDPRTSSSGTDLSATTPDVIDIRSGPAPDLETLAFRIERLETGLRLMVDTLRRTYGDLANSVRLLTYEVRNQHGKPNGGPNLQQSVASLNLMIDELVHSMRAFPHVLAVATDELAQRIETVETRTTKTLGELLIERETARTGTPPRSEETEETREETERAQAAEPATTGA